MKKVMFLSIALLFLHAVLHADLITHLTFDGTLQDATASENHGEFFGDIDPIYEEGYDGTPAGAVLFDGVDDYVRLTPNNALPITDNDAFSIALWVKGGVQDDDRVFSESSSLQGNTLFNIGTDADNTTSNVDIYIRDDSGGALVAHQLSQGIAFDTIWHHIAWVEENGNAMLYIDGVLDQVTFSYSHDNLTVDTTTIGGIHRELNNPQGCCFFTGLIDDVRLYDHALTIDEIVDLIPPCPNDNDTHCDGLEIIGPESGEPGTYTAFVNDASDESGDPIIYMFTAENGEGELFESGPITEMFYEFQMLSAGTWTITARVDDSLACPDDAADAVCSQELIIECPTEGDTLIEEMFIEGPEDGGPGTYTVYLSGIEDDSGDSITCTITADNGVDTPIVQVFTDLFSGSEVTALLTLGEGSWEITAEADDNSFCDDVVSEGVKTEQITIETSDDMLVSHWSLDGTLDDAAEQGNLGEFFGDTLDPDYVPGFDETDPGAVAFDGGFDYIQVQQNNHLPIYAHNAYSVCMWVNGPPAQAAVDPDPAINVDSRVFSEGNSDPAAMGINPLLNIGTHNNADPATGDLGCVDIYIRNNNGQVSVPHTKSQRAAFDNTWHHIAWIDDNGKAVLYIDGVRDATDFSYDKGQLSLDTTSIGAIVRLAPSHFFTGMIDDVRVYNYALSHEEVLELVPEPEGCPETGDTHAGGLSITSPGAMVPGLYFLEATGAADDSGDPILYTFTAENEEGFFLQSGPSESSTAEIFFSRGTWTVTVTVDDDLLCRDEAADASASEVITITAELVSHWPFDGSLEDAGPGENHGEMANGLDPTFTEGYDGTPDGAILLNGSTEYVEIIQNDQLPITLNLEFTIALWVKGPHTQNDRRVFSEASTMSNTPLFNIGTHNQGVDGTVDGYIRGDTGNPLNHVHSQQTAFDNTWHHIAWVDRNGQVDLYVDGVLDGVSFNYTKPVSTLDTTSIGGIQRPSVANKYWFQGAIDDVRVYNYALSAEEVEELASGTGTNEIHVYAGDANGDLSVNLADAVHILSYFFAGGAESPCMKAADANNDDSVNIADAVTVLTYFFSEGFITAPDGTTLDGGSVGCYPYLPEEVETLGCETPCAE